MSTLPLLLLLCIYRASAICTLQETSCEKDIEFTPLEHTIDGFDNVKISKRAVLSLTDVSFAPAMAANVEYFASQGRRAIFLPIPVQKSEFIAPAMLEPLLFELHHAEPTDYLMLQKWLLSSQNKLPPFASHYIGSSGLLFNSKRQVLLEREKFMPQEMWNFPGGQAEYYESVMEAVLREIKEETAIEASAIGLLGFREVLNYRFGRPDLMFIFLCEVSGEEELKLQEEEVEEVRWFELKELVKFQKLTRVVKHMLPTIVEAIEKTGGTVDDFDVEQVFGELKSRTLKRERVAANNAEMYPQPGAIFVI